MSCMRGLHIAKQQQQQQQQQANNNNNKKKTLRFAEIEEGKKGWTWFTM